MPDSRHESDIEWNRHGMFNEEKKKQKREHICAVTSTET
jgi:hypothetical protein